MSIDQDITNLPTPPSRSDSPSDFSDKADTFLAALPQLQTELNLYADEANSTQTEINLSETNAATSEQNAEDWASLTSGIVLSTDYSAKAYAISTDLIPEGAAKEWSLKTDGSVDTTEYSAKAYALSADLVPDGSAKEWAIKIGSTVDGTEFSAKKYANDAEASASAAAATAGAVAWSSTTTYDKNDAAIGSDGNTYRSIVDNNLDNDPVLGDGSNWLNLTGYLDEQETRNLFFASGDLSYNSSTGEFSVSLPALARTPVITEPLDGAQDVAPNLTIEGSAFSPVYSADQRDYRQIQIIEAGGTFASPAVDEQISTDDYEFSADPDADYQARIRDKILDGAFSAWSEIVSFNTANIFVEQPTITSPADGATNIPEQPVIESSAFSVFGDSDTHVASQWVITRVSDSAVVFDSGEDSSNLESIEVPAGVLDEGEVDYTVKVRHKGSAYGFSDYSLDVTFTTADVFFEYIEPNIGQPVGGGYYAGNVVSDVDGQTYAIIVSGGAGDSFKSSGIELFWSTTSSSDTWAQTLSDGKSAMDHVVNNETLSNYPAFEWIENNLNAGSGLNGYTDWYLPARDEMEIIYRNFKPSSQDNQTGSRPTSGFGGDGATYGTNNNSVPTRSGYTTNDPSITSFTNFQSGSADEFRENNYWVATENTPSIAWLSSLYSGQQMTVFNKSGTAITVRAVRRVAL